MTNDIRIIKDAQEFAQRATDLAERGQGAAALSALAMSIERLCVYLGRQELHRQEKV